MLMTAVVSSVGSESICLLLGALQAAAYMHRSRLLHRDLKPANILISEAEEIKLCDFGFARMMVGKSEAEYTTYVVTRWYRAPEIIVNDAYGPAVDIWAIGEYLDVHGPTRLGIPPPT
jgi:serine/threonine protein kinase